MLEEVKKHPYVVGGLVLGVVVLFLLMGSGGGNASGVVTASSGSDVETANAAAASAQNAQSQIALGNLQLQGLNAQIGGTVEVEKIRAGTADNANTLAAGVAAQQINAALAAVTTKSTLDTQVQLDNNKTTRDLAQISSATSIAQTQAITGALISQAQINAQTTQSAINANRDIATQSWWDSIF